MFNSNSTRLAFQQTPRLAPLMAGPKWLFYPSFPKSHQPVWGTAPTTPLSAAAGHGLPSPLPLRRRRRRRRDLLLVTFVPFPPTQFSCGPIYWYWLLLHSFVRLFIPSWSCGPRQIGSSHGQQCYTTQPGVFYKGRGLLCCVWWFFALLILSLFCVFCSWRTDFFQNFWWVFSLFILVLFFLKL